MSCIFMCWTWVNYYIFFSYLQKCQQLRVHRQSVMISVRNIHFQQILLSQLKFFPVVCKYFRLSEVFWNYWKQNHIIEVCVMDSGVKKLYDETLFTKFLVTDLLFVFFNTTFLFEHSIKMNHPTFVKWSIFVLEVYHKNRKIYTRIAKLSTR